MHEYCKWENWDLEKKRQKNSGMITGGKQLIVTNVDFWKLTTSNTFQ
jgi:hypothetical protein